MSRLIQKDLPVNVPSITATMPGCPGEGSRQASEENCKEAPCHYSRLSFSGWCSGPQEKARRDGSCSMQQPPPLNLPPSSSGCSWSINDYSEHIDDVAVVLDDTLIAEVWAQFLERNCQAWHWELAVLGSYWGPQHPWEGPWHQTCPDQLLLRMSVQNQKDLALGKQKQNQINSWINGRP